MAIIRNLSDSSNDNYNDDGFSQNSLTQARAERDLKESSAEVRPDAMDIAKRNSIQAEIGETIFNTDTGKSEYWNGSSWVSASEGGGGGGGGAVASVNGEVGVVVLNTDDINEGTTNEYYTDAKVSANTDVVANTAKNSYPSADATKLAGIETGAEVNDVSSVNGEVGVVVLDTDDINEGSTNEYYTEAKVSANIDVVANTAKNSYPSADATKLSGIEASAEVNDTASEIKTKYESNSNTNAFTDTEKSNLANQSGTNTGDQDLSGLQDTLVSGTNIKTINNTSILGSGNIEISGGSGSGSVSKEWTFGRWVDFNADGRWISHYNSQDGAQLLNWNRGTGTDPSIPNYYGFILLEPNSVLKKLVLSALYDSVYTAIDIQIWGAEANATTVTKLYSGTFSPVSPDTSLQSYDRYELDMGDISLTNSHRRFVAVRQQQATLATKTVKGQIKLIWEQS